ncbi:chromosome segregation protein SMC [Heyndrickxia ginsengihumi]|nr:chromosome segregation protein SMC [Heyndrickxia ginsengihumi]MCM3022464.1 chromosome segregation protein SMC [Heyndrickxia ginsengihumi]
MFLKHLDVVGFKSFAERISVEFVPGVTAVVGPNGSGKSNVIDAVRWVLGEQSAKSLRGGKMEDVIFAGSESRKPLNFAEVTITLNNEDHTLPIDYQEVSVTRRVYRTGDSEFFINKQACRLKDIIDLFMDSGLGKEAFSIIGQGKVDEILNSKAEERRKIFEEAAGVLKYKTRKKKAEVKLTETQDNLNRVNDIIYELESQVEPLKIQASIAKDYLEQKEELKNYEVAVMVHEIEELHHNWEQLQEKIEVNRNYEGQFASNIKKDEANIEKLRDQMAALDESINDLQNVLLTATEELEKLEGRKEVLKERKKNAHQNKEQLEQNIKEASENVAHLKEQKERIEKELADNEAAAVILKEELKEKTERLSQFNIDIDEKIDSLKSDYIELLNEQATGKNEKHYLEQQLQQHVQRIQKLNEDNQKYVDDRKRIQHEKEQMAASLKQIGAEIEQQVVEFRDEQRHLESLKNQYQKQQSTLYQAYQIVQKAKSRKETLEEMEEDYTGFYQGVREVLKARNTKLEGIEGAVAELIQVSKSYEKAIEIALGGAMQHIVVQSELYGRKAIEFLKKNRYGRATFLPLNVIKPKTVPSNQLNLIRSHTAFIGVASDLVDVPETYRSIIGNLLGNVIVAQDLQGANEIAKALQYRYRLVTLEGDVVSPGGAMTGGATKQGNVSLLSRKGELEDLKEKLIVMEEKTVALEETVKSLKRKVAEEEEKLEQLRMYGEQLRLQEQNQQSELKRIELEEKNLNDRLMLYDMEKSESEAQIETIHKRIDEINALLASSMEQSKQLELEIQSLTSKKQDDTTSKAQLQDELSDLKAKLAVKHEQVSRTRDELERTSQSLEEWLARKHHFEDQFHFLVNEVSNNHTTEEELAIAAEKKLIDKQDTVSLISMRREERLQLQAKLEDLELNLRELQRQQKGVLEAIQDQEVKLNRLDVELENRLNRLREEYTLSFEAAKLEYTLSMPIEEARKKVKLIKLSIDELGTVNLGAIEEYERVAERYQFLKEQQTDLAEAKETLVQIIDEMDEEMVRRFDETFRAIRAEFNPTFAELFGGGQADLKLTEPKDLLNTGVEIVAQPPGKKLQNLGLLSGGERALTAIALLFAILRVRPVPFCILDEVEAALDEANVFRFSKYLKQFSQDTQFIVITHRKGTMEEADVLYGVTMQESGVSKLVSVRLEESDHLVGQA